MELVQGRSIRRPRSAAPAATLGVVAADARALRPACPVNAFLHRANMATRPRERDRLRGTRSAFRAVCRARETFNENCGRATEMADRASHQEWT